jgi:N4-bis(aminopropyl)spermidine synthase
VPAAPISAVADLLAEHRPRTRALRRLIALLTGEPATLAALIQGSALPRQTVESVLSALGEDLFCEGDEYQIAPGMVAAYRRRFGYEQLMGTELADPLAARLAETAALEQSMAGLIARAPAARTDLDHVPATAQTVVRRALWLDSTYDLGGAVLLFVGDHDLTSLAVGQVSPGADLIVVDIDEQTLEFIDDQASRLGLSVRCLAGDLRFGLPARAVGHADLVFTDPPYTPQGLELFTARGLQGLANRDNGAVIVAYGYSHLHPTLGFQVQSAAHRLSLVYETVLADFNRYTGAQAIGSASDLYVWRPTPRTWRTLDRLAAGAEGIYTRGTQAVEARTAGLDAIPPAVVQAAEAGGYPISLVIGSVPAPRDGTARLRLATLFTTGIPAAIATARGSVIADLSADPGSWLLRALLAINASRAVLLVPNNHPDLASQAAQHALAALLEPKYRLRFLRSQPDAQHAIVLADQVDQATLDPAGRLRSRLLSRAHGKAGNIWREGLIESAHQHGGAPVSKRDARALVEDHSHQPAVLDTRLIDLPRHQIARLLADVTASAGTGRVTR